jgi:hypothetical protein
LVAYDQADAFQLDEQRLQRMHDATPLRTIQVSEVRIRILRDKGEVFGALDQSPTAAKLIKVLPCTSSVSGTNDAITMPNHTLDFAQHASHVPANMPITPQGHQVQDDSTQAALSESSLCWRSHR